MEFLGLLFALAAGVWGIYLAHRVSLQLLALVVLIVGTVFGPVFFAINGPIQFSIDRILWFVMLGLFALRSLRDRTRPIELNRMDWLIVAFVGWLLLSMVISDAPQAGPEPLARWIFYALLPMGMYIVARFARLSRFELRVVQRSFIGLGIYLGLTALAEKAELKSLVFPRFIIDPEYIEFLGRGRGPLLNPTGNGFLLSIGIAAMLLAFQHRSRFARLGYGIAMLAAAGGVFATLTRSVWIAAIAAVSLTQFNRISRGIRIWAVVTSLVLAGGLAIGFGDQILNLKRDKNLSASAAADSIALRPMLAVIAWEMFKERPLTGVGYGHYFAFNQQYAKATEWEMPLRTATSYHQHNVLLSYLVDTGLIGAGLWIIMAIGWGMKAWQISRSSSACPEAQNIGLLMIATLSSYLLNGMFQDVSIIPMLNMYLFYFAGLTVAVDSVDGRLPERNYADRRRAVVDRRAAGAMEMKTVSSR
ncbi:O-Antigen ligase [Rosistilla ulvae]|uniref:O-Antigen ligase n=1 Tax=Rosistilla ulvae TaxID=1930277 RepID=A0A517LWR3_9BACT|nr:O-Antigen ligase [Rosistilla ulvae]